MTHQARPKFGKIFRGAKNVHRYFYFYEGKLRSFVTDVSDINNNLAELFGFFQRFTTSNVRSIAGASLLAVLAGATPLANALPTGYQSQAGNVQFSQAGNTLNVTAHAARSIANYQTFNVAGNETVNFNLPSASSAILNRVMMGNPSQIFGSINSNGQVFLINPSGIFFNAGSHVNVGSLFASTLGITNQNFLSKNLQFSKDPSSPAAAVVNNGSIVASNGGYVVLVGSAVSNTGGIQAISGQIQMAVGDHVTAATSDTTLVDFTVDQAVKKKVDGFNTAVANAGVLNAADGRVVLQAQLTNSIYQAAVNNSGRIAANSITHNKGAIVLAAASGDGNATVTNTGTLDVSGYTSTATGGKITVVGDNVAISGCSNLNASGTTGGGTIQVGTNQSGSPANIYVGSGSTLNADAVQSGNGGNVALKSGNNTYFYGSATARGGSQSGNGGLVEISGRNGVDYRGSVDTRAPHGRIGQLLFDPANILIVDGPAGTGSPTSDATFTSTNLTTIPITAGTINNAGQNTDVTLQATNDINGNNLSTPINISHALTLEAGHDVNLQGSVTASAFTATAGNTIRLTAPVTASSGSIAINANTSPAAGLPASGTGIFTNAPSGTLTAAAGNINVSAAAVSLNGSMTANNIVISTLNDIAQTAGTLNGTSSVNLSSTLGSIVGITTGSSYLFVNMNTPNITLNAPNGHATVNDSASATLHASNLGNALQVVDGGNLVIDGLVQATSPGSQMNIITTGNLSANNSGALFSADTLALTSTNGNIFGVTTTFLTTGSLKVQAGTLNVFANNGSANVGDRVSATLGDSFAAKNLTVFDSNKLTIGGNISATAPGGTVILTATNDVTKPSSTVIADNVSLASAFGNVYGATTADPFVIQAGNFAVNTQFGTPNVRDIISGNLGTSNAFQQMTITDSGNLNVVGNVSITYPGNLVLAANNNLTESSTGNVVGSNVSLTSSSNGIYGATTGTPFNVTASQLTINAPSGFATVNDTVSSTLHASTVANALQFSDAGDVVIDGPVQATSGTSQMNIVTAGNLSANNSGALFNAGTLALTSTNGSIFGVTTTFLTTGSLKVQAPVLTVTANKGSANVGDRVSATLGDSSALNNLTIFDSNKLTVAGNITATASNGSVALTATNDVTQVGGSVVANNVSLASAFGNVYGATTANPFVIQAPNFAVNTHFGSANVLDTVSGNLGTSQSYNQMNITDSGNLNVVGNVSLDVIGNIVLTANNNLTQATTGTVSAFNLALNANNGSIYGSTTALPFGAQATFLAVSAPNGSANVNDATGATLNPSTALNSLTVTDNATLTLNGNIQATGSNGVVTLGSNGSLNQAAGTVIANTVNLSSTNGSIFGATAGSPILTQAANVGANAPTGNVTLTNTGNANFLASSANAVFTFVNNGTLTQTGNLTVNPTTGAVNITANSLGQSAGVVTTANNAVLTTTNGNISGTTANNAFQTAVNNLTVNAAGNSAVQNSQNLVILSSTATGANNLFGTGSVSVAGTVSGNTVLMSTNGPITVSTNVGSPNSVTLTSTAGPITVNNNGALIAINGLITLTGSSVTADNGAINAGQIGTVNFVPNAAGSTMNLGTAPVAGQFNVDTATFGNTAAGTIAVGNAATSGQINLGRLNLNVRQTDLVLDTLGNTVNALNAGPTGINVTLAPNANLVLTGGWNGTGGVAAALASPGMANIGSAANPLFVSTGGGGQIFVKITDFSGTGTTFQQTTPSGVVFINPVTITPTVVPLSLLVLPAGATNGAANLLYVQGNQAGANNQSPTTLVINNTSGAGPANLSSNQGPNLPTAQTNSLASTGTLNPVGQFLLFRK